MRSGVRAQTYVEYGLLVGVVAIAFLVGLTALMGGATTYLTHAEPTPNATVLASLPIHVVSITMSCAPPPPPVYTGQPFTCSLTVTDITTIEAGTLPRGTIDVSQTTGTSPGCQLNGPIGNGVTSGCTFQYTPTHTRRQNITATYIPTSNHESRAAQLQQPIVAIDKTMTQLACTSPVPVGEPSLCSVGVLDVFTNQLLPGVTTTVATAGGAPGTFSRTGALSPRRTPYACRSNGAGVCGTLFRSGATGPSDEGAHPISASFQADQDHDSSNTSTVITVGGPTQHPVAVDVQCAGGRTPASALQINLGASTACTATVTDTNAADSNGNPTNITPTGTLMWTSSQDSGGTGSLSTSTCTLQRVTDTAAQCQPQPVYTPTSAGTPPAPDYVGTHQVTATYSSDWIHPQAGAQDSTDIYVTDQHQVQVNVTCSPGTTRASPLLILGASADIAQCTVSVVDVNGVNPVTPTGTVDWSLSANGGTGAFTPTGPCQLQPINGSTASCQAPVSYEPTARGVPDGADQESTHTIVATYFGDWLHPLINNDLVGSTNVFVGNLTQTRVVQVTPTCSPATTRLAPLHVGPPASTVACTVEVADTSPPDANGTPTALTPTGTVSWSELSGDGTGVFSPSAPCQLVPAGNATSSCQTSVTYQPTARGTPDGPDMINTHQIVATYLGDAQHPPDEMGKTPVYVGN